MGSSVRGFYSVMRLTAPWLIRLGIKMGVWAFLEPIIRVLHAFHSLAKATSLSPGETTRIKLKKKNAGPGL
jgi:hypothetical protein